MEMNFPGSIQQMKQKADAGYKRLTKILSNQQGDI